MWLRGGWQVSEDITLHTYQRAKYLAMTDCYLRSRGSADFLVVGDLDELVYTGQTVSHTGRTIGGGLTIGGSPGGPQEGLRAVAV
eukprot:239583-Prorocentrum_minimum.AAC.1